MTAAQPMAGAAPLQSGTGSGSVYDESLSQVQAALAASGAAAASPFATASRATSRSSSCGRTFGSRASQGSARIDKLTDTGQIVGDERLYTMQVTLKMPGKSPKQLAESAAMVPLTAMHKVRIGANIPVRVAADNENLMMFEWDKA